MSKMSNIATRAFAAVGSVALTATLLVASFASPQATNVVGMPV